MLADRDQKISQGTIEQPWQLRLFRKTLKKKQKVKLLSYLLGSATFSDQLLLITNGDNNGAMNYYFRQMGGEWTWAEFEAERIPEMRSFLGDEIVLVRDDQLNFQSGRFDRVVVIDVHEHLIDTAPFDRELFRIVRPGGRVIVSTPNGDSHKWGIRIKNLLGMTKDVYGHIRDGYTIPEMRALLSQVGFRPKRDGSYSNFFTEMVELAINLTYVKLLNRRKDAPSQEHSPIAPSNAEQVRRIHKTLRLYSLIYPFCRAVSWLDVFLDQFTTGYAIVVEFEKPGNGH